MAILLQPSQRQSQTITPAMMIESSLLQLPISELRAEVKREIDSNPALEVANARGLSGRIQSAGGLGDLVDVVAADGGESLDEHLLSELRMSGIEGRELELCRAIIADIDEDGRFKGSLPDLRMVTDASIDELEAARRRIMSIDPKGCGARDLAECFLAQIEKIPSARRGEIERAIAALAEMMGGKAPTAKLNVAPDILKLLRGLDPYPGRQFDRRKTDFVTPDVVVDKDGDVWVDQGDIPELRVSPKYVEMAKDRTLDEETRTYAAERVRRAREFREALLRRQDTMEKIAELAIGGQTEFLAHGVAGLRRQTMSEVAKRAKCTIATVSRAASRKYVKTPRGVVPLRKFFVLVDQEPLEKLREILEGQPPGQRLSDQKVSELMAKAGYTMARRTVAKYRARLLGRR